MQSPSSQGRGGSEEVIKMKAQLYMEDGECTEVFSAPVHEEQHRTHLAPAAGFTCMAQLPGGAASSRLLESRQPKTTEQVLRESKYVS